MRGDDDEDDGEVQRGLGRDLAVNGGRCPRGPFETAVEAARAVSLILVATIRARTSRAIASLYFCKRGAEGGGRRKEKKERKKREPPPRVSGESIIGRESTPPSNLANPRVR